MRYVYIHDIIFLQTVKSNKGKNLLFLDDAKLNVQRGICRPIDGVAATLTPQLHPRYPTTTKLGFSNVIFPTILSYFLAWADTTCPDESVNPSEDK